MICGVSKTRTLSIEDLVMLWGQCNLGLLVFHISVSLTSQKIPQNYANPIYCVATICHQVR